MLSKLAWNALITSQGRWNLAQRDMERDIVPMCRHNGMAIGTRWSTRVTMLADS